METSNKVDTSIYFTPLSKAVDEILERRKDTELVQRANKYLNNDVPVHFNGDQPIMYLSRHIATPNFETLRFVELAKPFNLPMYIGQDSKGKFVSNNETKICLGKMSIVKGYAHDNSEIIEKITVVDFSKAQGKRFSDIQTLTGENLVTFHNNLFNTDGLNLNIHIAEESSWVDRNHRDDLLKQYKKMLALLCVHGIMFESYPVATESELVLHELKPAFDEIVEIIGCRPLIVEHIDDVLEETRDWNSYPNAIYNSVYKNFNKQRTK